MANPVRYTVSMSRPHSHLFEVEARFPFVGETLMVSLPVWTPGSYLVREYARHLQEVQAFTPNGEPLPLQRIDKKSFRVHTRGHAVVLKYKVYANELTVRTNHLDGTHGYFNGTALFLYEDSLRKEEHRVTVQAPAGWQTYAALPRQKDEFVAADYDELVDSPFEVTPTPPIDFVVGQVPHRVVLWGEPNIDKGKLVKELTRICETEAALFGGLPMKEYLFIVHGTDKGRGGLEHKASTTLLFSRNALSQPKGWEDFLTLVAHEYFHLWNVKRIKPRALVPFDYGQENYTSLLWAFEGATSYYDNLLVRRAELMTPARYLTRLGETLSLLHSTPGRKVMTLNDASLLAWVKHYRPDENTGNTAISYYLKGEVVSLLLDLHIRRATKNARSLDDVMRLLWERHGDESGVTEEGVEKAASEVAGTDLSSFFDRAIRSTEELDLSVLSHVGLEAHFRERESAGDKGGTPPKSKEGKPRGWLGLTPRGQSIATVAEGSPAMNGGLYADDELVALDGYKVDGSSLVSRCEEKKPGETVTVSVFRREKLLDVSIVLGPQPKELVYLAKVPHPTEAQKESYRAWLKAPWDEGSAPVG